MSSTVWCASTSMSPVGPHAQVEQPVFGELASMWSKNGTPVLTSAVPLPSRSSATSTLVSLVTRSTRPGPARDLVPGVVHRDASW